MYAKLLVLYCNNSVDNQNCIRFSPDLWYCPPLEFTLIQRNFTSFTLITVLLPNKTLRPKFWQSNTLLPFFWLNDAFLSFTNNPHGHCNRIIKKGYSPNTNPEQLLSPVLQHDDTLLPPQRLNDNVLQSAERVHRHSVELHGVRIHDTSIIVLLPSDSLLPELLDICYDLFPAYYSLG